MTVPAPPRRHAALLFIFVTVLIDILSFGIIIPVLPHLLEKLTGDIAHAAIWAGVLSTMFAPSSSCPRRSRARCRIASGGGR